MFKKFFGTITRHKILTFIIIILLIVAGGYFGYKSLAKNKDTTQYVTAAIEKGTLVVSVVGSGQVSAADQKDIKPKVSGDITWIGMEVDKDVQQGQAILFLDDADIKKQIADAEWDLSQEKESYDEITMNAERSLKTAYEDGQSTVSTTFFKLSDYMKDLKDVLGTEKSVNEYVSAYRLVLGSESPFIQKLLDDYDSASDIFNEKFAFFREASGKNDRDTIYKLINDTLETTKSISQALESARHMYDAIIVKDYKYLNIASHIDTMQPKIESDVSSVYSNISSLQKIKDTIDDTNNNTPNDIAVAQNNVQKKEDALKELKKDLDNYTIKAPFTGVIAKVNVKKGDSVSSGTALATIITKKKIAEITLNEIDATKVKKGQKATITFDAAEGLTVVGEVAEIDTLGTVSQGVVTYGIKIAFDIQDERIKSGMSLSAAIIIEVRQNAFLAPNSAIKFQNDEQYVEIMENNAPVFRSVEVGISNDTMTEIISGLQEGDEVVTQTTNSNKTSSGNTTTSGDNPGSMMRIMR